jgi:hypothetical protein
MEHLFLISLSLVTEAFPGDRFPYALLKVYRTHRVFSRFYAVLQIIQPGAALQ